MKSTLFLYWLRERLGVVVVRRSTVVIPIMLSQPVVPLVKLEGADVKAQFG